MIGGAIICLILIIGVIRLISGLFGHGKEKTTDTVAEESTFQASDISVNGISLKGMTKSEAKAAIEAKFPWNVKISYNGESVDADNMIDTELDAFWTGFLLTRMAENIHSRWKILKICSPQRQRQQRTRRRSGM